MQFEDFQQHTLANLELAEQEAQAEKLSLPRALILASVLLSHGHPKAARPINLLKHHAQDEEVRKIAELFERSFVHLREIFRFEELTLEQLAAFYQTSGLLYLRRKERLSRLLVIFTTVYNNFYYSNAALAGILSNINCDLLFLRDTSYFVYMKGAKEIADDFPSIGDKILELAQRNAIEKIFVTGFSSASYAALHTSLQIPSHGYLGFSQAIDPNHDLANQPQQFRKQIDQIDRRWLPDLRQLLERADPAIPRAMYYGDRSKRDVGQAHHVEGTPGIMTICLPGVRHNTVQSFHLDRLLEAFATLIDERSDWPAPEAANPVAVEVEINQGI